MTDDTDQVSERVTIIPQPTVQRTKQRKTKNTTQTPKWFETVM